MVDAHRRNGSGALPMEAASWGSAFQPAGRSLASPGSEGRGRGRDLRPARSLMQTALRAPLPTAITIRWGRAGRGI